MLVLRHRLAIAGIIAAAAVAVPAAAFASGLGTAPGKSTSPPAAAASGVKSPAPSQAAAARAGKSGPAPSLPDVSGPAAVSALATRLGVSTNAAGTAFKEISRLDAQNGSVDPASSAFAAIARQLGVSPAQLAAAWDAVEHSAAG